MKLRVRQLRLAVAGRTLVEALDFDAEPGQLWCVLGRNGCGKTTLLQTLAGLRQPDGGCILLDERPLAAWDWRALARARAMVPQKTTDAFASTVLETVLVGRSPYRARGWTWGGGQGQDLRHAHAALAALDLLHLAERDVRSLSGGERQRVALAAMLAQTPTVALLDELTAHLDLDAEQQVLRLLAARAAAQQSPALVLASLHDVNLAQRFATHVLLFDGDGQVLAGPRATILSAASLSHAYRHPVRCIEAEGRSWFVAT